MKTYTPLLFAAAILLSQTAPFMLAQVVNPGAGTGSGGSGAGGTLCTGSGSTSTAFTCTPSPAVTYVSGMPVTFTADTNGAGGAMTVNLNSLGAKALKMPDGTTNLGAADIVSGVSYGLSYNGTAFLFLGAAQNMVGVLTTARLPIVNSGPGSCGDSTHVCEVTTNGNGLVTVQAAQSITFPSVPTGSAFQGYVAFSLSDTTATVVYGTNVTIADAHAVTGACYIGTPAAWTPVVLTGASFSTTQAVFSFTAASGSGWCVANWSASVRTYYHTYYGTIQGGASGYAFNTPAGGAGHLAPNFINAGGDGSVTMAQWPCYTGGGCATTYASLPFAWATWILEAGYVTNAPISFTVESTCDVATSCDSTNANLLVVGLACSGTSATLNSPTFVDASGVSIVNAASGNQTITTSSITPNSGGLPACVAGNRVWLRVKVDTETHTLTGPFDLASITFWELAGY